MQVKPLLKSPCAVTCAIRAKLFEAFLEATERAEIERSAEAKPAVLLAHDDVRHQRGHTDRSCFQHDHKGSERQSARRTMGALPAVHSGERRSLSRPRPEPERRGTPLSTLDRCKLCRATVMPANNTNTTNAAMAAVKARLGLLLRSGGEDRKSTRLN